MKALRTYKLKIISKHQKFAELAVAYKDAANWLSVIVFNRNKINTSNQLSNEFYSTIRDNFNLPSQLTCSLFRHVVSTYRSLRSKGIWEQATYKKTNMPLCWKKDFNKSKKGVSIWGEVISFESRELPPGQWHDSKLKFFNHDWCLHLVIEVEIPDPKVVGGTIGVDRGQKNILCAVDPKTNKTIYVKGSNLNHCRLNLRQTIAKAASVGTHSARRLLRRLSGKVKAVTQGIIHVASKQLVAFAENINTMTIAFEDLTGFKKRQTKDNKQQHRKQRARNNRWPYALLEFFASYKAAAVGIIIDHVSAKHTSQGCPKCGHVSKSNRNGLNFKCVACGYADNADRVGGLNVGLRSLLQRQAAGERATVN